MAKVETLTASTSLRAPAVPSWRPYQMVLIGIVIASAAALLVRQAQGEGVPSMVIVAVRMSLSALLLTPLVLRRYSRELRHMSRKEWLLGIAAGITLGVHFMLLFVAYENTSILIAGVLAGSAPLWVALLEVFVLKTRLSRVVWIGLFLAIFGSAVISLPNGSSIALGSNPVTGAVFALSSALVVAFHLLMARSIRVRMPSLAFSWIIAASAGLTALMVVALTRLPLAGYSPKAYLWLILLTMGPQLIAGSAFGYSLAYLPAVFMSLLGQVVTVLSAVLAFLLFSEVPAPLQIAGSVIVIVGVVLAGQRKPSSLKR